MSKIKDLSSIAKPIGGFLKKIPTRSQWNQYRLTSQQIAEYKHDGFVPNIQVLTPDQTETLLNDYSLILNAVNEEHNVAKRSWSTSVSSTNLNNSQNNDDILSLLHEYHANETGDDNNLLFHCLGHWRVTEGFHDLIYHPSITVPCSQLLYIDSLQNNSDPDADNIDNYDEVCVRFWHDQLFAKPANTGGNVAFHQDYSYWTRTKPMQHITVHIALDEQNEDNGAIAYVPGSHKWHRINKENNNEIMPLPITDLHFIDMHSIFDILTEDEKKHWKLNMCYLKPGECVIHHALSVHGSYENHSDKPRRAAVLNYFKDGTYSNTNEPLLKGMDIVPQGHKLQTKFNPIVYNPLWKEQQ